ncbi:MAG: hypothetical protein COA62_08505 [Rhodobiaceae bacterium]|nr:MAG: hypothetical protein COA62_08505 [Rhodobiaceae bacterium]
MIQTEKFPSSQASSAGLTIPNNVRGLILRLGFAALGSLMLLSHPGEATAEGNTLGEAILGGKPLVDIRLRYETVDQGGLPNNADATTLRARLGYETGNFEGFSLLVEGDFIIGLGAEDYNDTINGRTTFPVVADPEDNQLNRAQIMYAGIPDTTFIVGRQRVILDNARFVGNVGWRQNEQTFDAAVVATTFIQDTTLTYGYVDKIHRIFGRDHLAGRLDTSTHLINAKYSGIEGLTVTGYSYLLDVDAVPTASTVTYGVRVTGKTELSDGVVLNGVAEYARQSDQGNNPGNVSLDYYRGDAGVTYQGFVGAVGYEVLEGDGTVGFSTPLATLHAFNGWADVFLATPAAGLEDLFLKVGYSTSDVLGLQRLSGAVIYHDFESNRTGADLGSEWDAVINAKVDDHFVVTAKYASYSGPTAGPADRDKIWFQVGYKY